jgi:hypothetical protein
MPHEPHVLLGPLEKAKHAAAQIDQANAQRAHDFHHPAVREILNRAFPEISESKKQESNEIQTI